MDSKEISVYDRLTKNIFKYCNGWENKLKQIS